MTTATANKTAKTAAAAKAEGKPTHNRSRTRRVPLAQEKTPTVPTPVPAPRQRVVRDNGHKTPKVMIQSHFIPGKVAMATLTPDKLKELAFISTYSAKDDQSTSPRKNGYQREPMESRFPGIGRYYARDNNRHLITPLIASARLYNPADQSRFNTLFAKGDMATIHKEFGKNVFSIVDGQHRLGGLYWAWQNIEEFQADVPVMIYYGLHYTEEANLFDEINTNQRKLPKALIEATKVHMEAGDKSHEQFIREVAVALAQDGDSVWHGLVNMTGGPEGKGKPVTYEGLRRATGNMLPTKLTSRLQDRKLRPDKVAKRYWQMVSQACAVAWDEHEKEAFDDEGYIVMEPVKYKLKDLAGMAAVSRLGQDIITSALEKGSTEEDFNSAMADMVSRLGQVDWEKKPDNPWVATSAGFAGASLLYQLLYALVYLDKAPGEAVDLAE